MIARTVQSLAAIALVAAGLIVATPGLTQSRLEYAVKANYLVRFAAFVEWPASAFAGPDAPLVICVTGRDPFGTTLTRAAVGQTAHGRPIRIRVAVTDPTTAGCHILYLGNGAAAPASPASGRAILTVSDDAAQTRGGIMHFVIQASRVRFHVQEASARARGLSISSRLLALAVTVRGG